MAQRLAIGFLAALAGPRFRAAYLNPVMTQRVAFRYFTRAAGLRLCARRILPAVAVRVAFGHAAPVARLRLRARRILPAVALCFAHRRAALAARLRRRAGCLDPLVVADHVALLIAARRTHVVLEAVRLARRASLILRRHEFLATGAVKYIVDDVVIGMRAVVLRHARQRLFPALLRVVRQHRLRMLADFAAHRAHAVAPGVRLAFFRQRARHARGKHRRRQQSAQQFHFHGYTSIFPK